MTISEFLGRGRVSTDEDLRRCEQYRKSFPTAEVAFPAVVLRNRVIAKWVRDHRVAVDLRTGEDLAIAIAAGIHPSRLSMDADWMSESDLRVAARLGIGLFRVGSMKHIESLAAVDYRRHEIVVCLSDGTTGGFRFDSLELDHAIGAVLAGDRFNLVGLHCDVGPGLHGFLSYPAAVGQMITEMEHVRRHHHRSLTRVGLGGGRAVPTGDWMVALPELSMQIEQALDDECATLRFPRPLVVLTPGLTMMGQSAA
ncbi:LysA protein [Mycobacterium sp. NPDC048908]|uniref:LysA protein n=1 Tax=Mycobacterium sp. NPDC048908 TaxID=3364292 RepID=UPI0037203B7E